MQELLSRKDIGFLSIKSLAPNGFYTFKSILPVAPKLASLSPCYMTFIGAMASMGWVEDDTPILSGQNGYFDTPMLITDGAGGMALTIGNTVKVPANLHRDANGNVSVYVTRKVMPAAPTDADYLFFGITAVNGEGQLAGRQVGIAALFEVPSANPQLIPSTKAQIAFKFASYAKGVGDNTAHFALITKALGEIAAGQVPSQLAAPMSFATKTKDMAAGLYYVKSITAQTGGEFIDYVGAAQLLMDWQTMGTIVESDMPLNQFLPTWDGKIYPNASVKSVLPNRDAYAAFEVLSELIIPLTGSDRFMLITPYQAITPKGGYPYAPTKGFEFDLSRSVSALFAHASTVLGGLVMESNGANWPVAPGYSRDPFALAAPLGTPIVAPSMAALPAVMPTAPMALPAIPAAAPIPATLPTMPPAIDVPSTEAFELPFPDSFELPFADSLPGAVTQPMSAVAPAPPVAIAPPAPVVPVAPIPVAVPAPPVAIAPPAPVMPLPVAPAPVVAVSSTVSKARPRATVTL
jgi:hypothetical protein